VSDLAKDELDRFAETVVANSAIVGRADIAERVTVSLGRRAPRSVLLVGRPGSGRTATLSAIRSCLGAGGADAVSRGGVLRVDCGRLVSSGSAGLRAALETAGPTEVIALDDLELLLGLGAQTFDADAAVVARAAVGDSALRLIATIDSAYLPVLAAREPALAADFETVELPPLDGDALGSIARAQAEQLQAHHGVTMLPDVLDVAVGPAPPGARRAHPGLLVDRLDAACVHARLRGSDLVEMRDVDVYHAAPEPDVVDPERLRATLSARVAGQDRAVETVTSRLALTSRELDLSAHRPDGAFLFVGPTGVGKTELALALAEARYGDEGRLIRLDMSEFSEDHTVSRLIGSPPGYKGSDEPGGWLTTRVIRQPRSVVLFDEIEKAHPTVWTTLLQVLDAGRLTDGRGEVASFADAVVIMTSNLGTGHGAAKPVGFTADGGATAAASEKRIMDAVRETMPPELVNRIDAVIVFEALPLPIIEQIAAAMVERAVATLGKRGWTIAVEPDVVHHVASLGYDPAYGARHVKRAVEGHLLATLATEAPGSYRATLREGSIAWEPRAPDTSMPADYPIGRRPVRLRAALGSGSGADVVVVSDAGRDPERIAQLIVDTVSERLEVPEVVELLARAGERPIAIGGLSQIAATELHLRMGEAGADATITTDASARVPNDLRPGVRHEP
jgi:ATP-dependent Clp protease ATP-binding subunit ClpC